MEEAPNLHAEARRVLTVEETMEAMNIAPQEHKREDIRETIQYFSETLAYHYRTGGESEYNTELREAMPEIRELQFGGRLKIALNLFEDYIPAELIEQIIC